MIEKPNTTDEYLLGFREAIELDTPPSTIKGKVENIDKYNEFDMVINTYRLYKEAPKEK